MTLIRRDNLPKQALAVEWYGFTEPAAEPQSRAARRNVGNVNLVGI